MDASSLIRSTRKGAFGTVMVNKVFQLVGF